MEIFKNANYNFMRVRHIAYAVSGVVILVGLISLIVKGGPNFGVDFKGGVVIQARFDRDVTTDKVRSALSSAGITQLSVQHGEDRSEVIISTPEVQMAGGRDVSDLIKTVLMKPENPWQVDEKGINTDKVSASVGRDLVSSAIKSILLSLVLILVYVWLRFEFRFGLGGLIALFHDVLVTLGIFSLLNAEINLPTIAAFLTIVGYSLNDTIIVYDRIRENMKLLKGRNFDDIINISINQTLSRTIITQATSLMTVFAIFIFAKVGTLHTLSMALLIGFVAGTYSSIFIASPVVRAWHFSILKRSSES